MLPLHHIRTLIAAGTADLPDTCPDPATIDAQIAAFLATAAPGISGQVIGESAAGRPLRALTIAPEGDAATQPIMVIAGLRGDAPIGGATLLALARHLRADAALRAALDLTWWLIPCADPDALAGNAAWYAAPWSLRTHARQIVPAAATERIDWQIETPRPETAALRRVIAAQRPATLLGLYDVSVGGVALHQAAPDGDPPWRGRAADFARLLDSLGLPRDLGGALGPPEAALAPALYPLPEEERGADAYARFRAGRDTGVGPPAGTGLFARAAREQPGPGRLVGAVTVPRLVDYDRREQDRTPTTQARRAAAAGGIRLWREWCAFGRTALDLVLPLVRQAGADRMPAYRALTERLRDAEVVLSEGLRWAERTPDPDGRATIAEAFAAGDALRVARLPAISALIRVLDAAGEHFGPDAPDDLTATLARAGELRDRWIDDLAAGATFRPARLDQLAGAQLAAILLALP